MLVRVFILMILATFRIYASDDLRPKIGLALSGGGAKGLAHIGALKIIDSLQIPVDYIAGTSMGGIIGALYAIGYSAVEIERIVRDTDWDALFSDSPERDLLPYFKKKEMDRYQIRLGLDGFTPVIPSGLISGQKVSMLFSRLTHRYAYISDFDSLPIPFRCVAVDLVSGNEVIIRSGSLSRAMRATMSIPNIFTPVEWGDSLLIDGGLVNNFPVDIVRQMGAEVVIGVNVGAPLKSKDELADILDVFEQTFFLAGERRIEENKAQTELLISPELTGYTATSFDRDEVKNIIQRGVAAAAGVRDYLIQFKQVYDLKLTQSAEGVFLSPLIHSIDIKGNQSFSFGFIYNFLDIKPGQHFDIDRLERRLGELYALGYFQSINFSMEEREDNHVALTIHIREKPQRELRIGFRYDDFHQLVAAVSVQGTDILIPGLRLENEFQFAGLQRIVLQALLHSREFNFPFYPFTRIFFKDDPVNIYDLSGAKIASYKDRSTTIMAGIGIQPQRSFNIITALAVEYMNIKPDIAVLDENQFPRFKDRLIQLRIETDFDMLDNTLLPRKGYQIQSSYEGSFKKLGSKISYSRFNIDARMYLTLAEQHTLKIGVAYAFSQDNPPIYKAFYIGGPESFVGLDYTQMIADQYQIADVFYRYEYKKDIFLKLLFNAAYNYRFEELKPPAGHILFGYGIAFKFLSIIGPLELTFTRSELSPYQPGKKQNNMHVTAGYYF